MAPLIHASKRLKSNATYQAEPQSSQQCVPTPYTRSPLTTTSSPKPASESLLFKLPGELRNTIYAYAFSDTTWLINIRGTVDNPPANALSLLLVSRDIYAETRLLPFVYHTFSASHWLGIAHFLRGKDTAQRNAVTTVEVRFRFPPLWIWKTGGVEKSWLVSKEMAFLWLKGVKCIRLVGRAGREMEGHTDILERVKEGILGVREGVREGVRIETEDRD
jgi:hypothetical protein